MRYFKSKIVNIPQAVGMSITLAPGTKTKDALLTKDPDGGYVDQLIDVAWWAWQERGNSVGEIDEAFKKTGYNYGADAMEQVELGWELAMGEHKCQDPR